MSNEKGFTLLEILLALSILAVVGAMVGYGLHSTVQVVAATRDQRQVYRYAQITLARITSDLKSTIVHPDIAFEGISPKDDAESVTVLSFASLAHLSFDGSETGNALTKLQYRIVREPDTDGLYKLVRDDRLILPGQEDDEDQTSGFVLARGIRQLEIAFIDQDSQEVDSWDSFSQMEEDADYTTQLFPHAVRISLQFALNRDQDENLALQTMVWLPTAVFKADTGGE
ncbi:PulJ/GspJ family protein [Desulfogranum japonicum]|uniref:PulJ/GspJ family protein n=1 Tax=Desulfogranum japonicum TaxID=231447 RepID=UPI0004213784|nr:prepilin-type N-terminal cleavage/methylation domain-containing protein [Desulfogranum japonicum]